MAHCPFEKLSDLKTELEFIRKLPKVKEPKPGIFYIGAQSFLHFHTKDERRWADAREGKNWGEEMDIPLMATKTQKKKFTLEVLRRHSLTIKK